MPLNWSSVAARVLPDSAGPATEPGGAEQPGCFEPELQTSSSAAAISSVER
eukprot:CAMPEP_0170586028 /NCGR_PEP_ID=MMETSP0224-20130122/9529_1 /TAXON_ID=285029 /ORGANISM="Togula jolla, Strain CCCM 725" /LENGTH=50 /DNA_ID=CAMNT_0010909553 /DNA_START=504 /DNA_END=653 /DNA_ORIENTATION=-